MAYGIAPREERAVPMIWVTGEPGTAFYRSDKGTATVQSLDDGTWRWEGFPSDSIRGCFDMDGWWGISKTEEDAKAEAEKYLASV